MNKNKIFYLKFAECYEFVDDNLCVAAYSGRMVMGPTTMAENGMEKFDEHRQIIIGQKQFFLVAAALIKGKQHYRNKTDVAFIDDLEIGAQNSATYKLAATFGTIGDYPEPIFQLRKKWFYNNDRIYLDRVEKGLW